MYTHKILSEKTHTHPMRAQTRREERRERVRGVEREERCTEKQTEIEKGRGMIVIL